MTLKNGDFVTNYSCLQYNKMSINAHIKSYGNKNKNQKFYNIHIISQIPKEDITYYI